LLVGEAHRWRFCSASFQEFIAYPVVLLFGWIAGARLYQGWKLRRDRRK